MPEPSELLTALADPSTEVRRKALQRVRELPGDHSAYRDAVIAALADPAWTVREAASSAAAGLPDTDGAIHRALVALTLGDPKPHVRRAAAEAAVPHIHPERDYGDAIRHRFERQRMRAALALAHAIPEYAHEAAELLRIALADSHAKVRLAALRGLSLLPRDCVRPLLPVVARKCLEAEAAVRDAARKVWDDLLNVRVAHDTK